MFRSTLPVRQLTSTTVRVVQICHFQSTILVGREGRGVTEKSTRCFQSNLLVVRKRVTKNSTPLIMSTILDEPYDHSTPSQLDWSIASSCLISAQKSAQTTLSRKAFSKHCRIETRSGRLSQLGMLRRESNRDCHSSPTTQCLQQ